MAIAFYFFYSKSLEGNYDRTENKEKSGELGAAGVAAPAGGIRLIKESICQRLSLKQKRSSEQPSALSFSCALRAV